MRKKEMKQVIRDLTKTVTKTWVEYSELEKQSLELVWKNEELENMQNELCNETIESYKKQVEELQAENKTFKSDYEAIEETWNIQQVEIERIRQANRNVSYELNDKMLENEALKKELRLQTIANEIEQKENKTTNEKLLQAEEMFKAVVESKYDLCDEIEKLEKMIEESNITVLVNKEFEISLRQKQIDGYANFNTIEQAKKYITKVRKNLLGE